MNPDAPQPTLRVLIARLKGEFTDFPKRPGFGTCVGELRRRLIEMPSRGRTSDEATLAEARALLVDLDQRHLSTIAARILKDIDVPVRPPSFVDDVGRLHRFIEGTSRIFEPYQSPALAHALAILGELQRRGIKMPRTLAKRQSTKPKVKSYVHHPTLDDDYEGEQRVTLILGGKFEMNRRRH